MYAQRAFMVNSLSDFGNQIELASKTSENTHTSVAYAQHIKRDHRLADYALFEYAQLKRP